MGRKKKTVSNQKAIRISPAAKAAETVTRKYKAGRKYPKSPSKRTKMFSAKEEEATAKWLSEMAERGMGFKPSEFLDFVETVVRRENRKTPFKNNRPSYDWYYKFMSRNSHIVKTRKETPLETCRAKLTKEKTDNWYSKFKIFLTEKGLIDNPGRVWNADETGFSVGSIAGKIIGPNKKSQVPHVAGGHSKQRFTVMFCGAANGQMIPPFIIFPEPKPNGYNPLTGAVKDSAIAYTKKGLMDSATFRIFLEHFNTYAGSERPVVLLFDSVSSHIDMATFEHAKKCGIELYRLLPNATHVMQPLDKDGNVISEDQLKSGLTFDNTMTDHTSPTTAIPEQLATQEKQFTTKEITEDEKMKISFEAFQSVLNTPVREKYERRMKKGYDIQEKSPGFDAYQKLYKKSHLLNSPNEESHPEILSGLELLVVRITQTSVVLVLVQVLVYLPC
ncbi:uncharacterized protein LOC134237890 [Saccostrea cucullata]|uniref:uncharacterized protein LOC134237890 n=1 Tax=Saccostrea cuccullata TaxID=36930 RepID=UPI002ED01799